MSIMTADPCNAGPIGKVPIEWKCTTIGQLCNVKRGASPRPISDPRWFGGSTGWVRISDVTQSNKYLRTTADFLSEEGVSKSVRVNVGEVILTICATIGVPIIVDTDVCIHDGFVWFESLPDTVNREYWYYFLASKTDEFKAYKQTGTQGNLNTAIVGSVEFGLPSLPEQKKIARILSSVDSKLALIDQQITTTQTLKKGLMQKLFTQGVGTRDADGRWQPHTEFQETEFGWIPKTWDVNTLISKCSVIKDGTHFSPKSKDGPCLYITSKNIRFGRMDLTDVAYISEEEHKAIYAGSPVKQGDVLLTKDGANTGNAAINTLAHEFSLLSSVAFLRGQPTHLDNNFLLQLLLSPNSQQMIKSEMAGQAITRLTLKKISSFRFAFPPFEEQQEIARILSTVDRKQEHLLTQKNQTQQLKKGLMQKLLTGQIRVQPDPQDH